MYYQKLTSGNTLIEFHNNWLGEETVIVNGREVSKKSSVWGTNHYFTVSEEDEDANYILTTRVKDGWQIVVDLSRNGILIREAVPLQFGSKPSRPKNEAKRQGLAKLKEYDLDGALLDFEKALRADPEDPEIYFHMACAYSVQERVVDGFEALKKSKELGLRDEESVLNHDMLAFLRLQAAFEDFFNSGFTEYDPDRLAPGATGLDTST